MDDFKKIQNKNVGVGGLKCHCCTRNSRAKGRKKDKSFNKMVRKQLKTQIEKEIRYEVLNSW